MGSTSRKYSKYVLIRFASWHPIKLGPASSSADPRVIAPSHLPAVMYGQLSHAGTRSMPGRTNGNDRVSGTAVILLN
jgi:hypothetical protein